MLKKQTTTNMNSERAVDELKRQAGIVIRESGHYAIASYPAEFTDTATLKALRSPSLYLLITAARAKTLGLAAQDTKIEAQHLSLEQIKTLCDPLADAVTLPALVSNVAGDMDSMALKLVKYASLLPALLITDATAATSGWFELSVSDLEYYLQHPQTDVLQTARASLPLEGAEKTTLVSFRALHGTAVHLALLIGDIDHKQPPLTRIHSSCVTGDILGSLRCDCGDQLKLALSEICKAGSGILIYLYQEGRGIGITNKLRSYRLQEQGIDTFTANLMLGFDEDERDFGVAASILKSLNIDSIQMLTNNPQKLTAMEKAGITISARVPLISTTGAHNHAYIDAKAKKAGHLF